MCLFQVTAFVRTVSKCSAAGEFPRPTIIQGYEQLCEFVTFTHRDVPENQSYGDGNNRSI